MKKFATIMPCLDIRGNHVVKGLHFADPIDVGDPVALAVAYEASGADELGIWDLASSTGKKRSPFDVLRRVVSAVKIPVSFGGGIRSLAEMEQALEAGAKNITLSSEVARDPALAEAAVKQFGGTHLMAAMIVGRNGKLPSKREVLIDGGETPTGLDAIEFAKSMADAGMGRILSASKLCDGARRGYDLDLIRDTVEATRLPVVARGGAGKLIHFLEAVKEGHAGTVMASTVFHFGTLTVRQVKAYLVGQGVAVHHPPVQKM